MGSEVEAERTKRIAFCRSGQKRSGLFNGQRCDRSSGEGEISQFIGNSDGVDVVVAEGARALAITIRLG